MLLESSGAGCRSHLCQFVVWLWASVLFSLSLKGLICEIGDSQGL